MIKLLSFTSGGSTIKKLVLTALFLILTKNVVWSACKDKDILAPHEEKLIEAFNKIHEDNAMELKSLHADNATIQIACGKDQVRSGSFDDVFGQVVQKVDFAKTKIIHTITMTNDNNPEKGIFSFHWMAFVRTKDDCSSVFSGFAIVKFNKDGLVTVHKRFSNDCEEIKKCVFDEDMSQFKNT